jgi:hypothetical protein
MTFRIYNFAKMSRSSPSRIDPRMPLARHMAWIPSTNRFSPSPWRVPEPCHYNYAVRGPRALDCAFIRNQVFYREENTTLWWSLYFVPQDRADEFKLWAHSQDIDIYWYNNKQPQIRDYQRLLHNTACAELNDHERLFQMGYYANLRSKYFVDDDTELLSIMGPVRDRVLNDLGLEDTGKFDEAES